MMTLEWRYRALVLRLLLVLINRLSVQSNLHIQSEETACDDARAMLAEFERNS